MTKDIILDFVENNKFRVTPENAYSRCVDGRYTTEDVGATAMPGADEELLEVAFAACNKLGLTVAPERIREVVLETVGGVAQFHFHTDEHAAEDHAGVGMGCGHIRNSCNDCNAYGLTKEQGEFLVHTLAELVDQGAVQTVLHGAHQETAVLVIESEYWSVKPQRTLENGTVEEVFVYQKTLTTQRLDSLAEHLLRMPELQHVAEADLKQVIHDSFNAELGETVQRLASGLPCYTVRINEEGQLALE